MSTETEQATAGATSRGDGRSSSQAPIEVAFKVFTERSTASSPGSTTCSSVEIAETVFERRVGGCLYDRGADGSECRWARVLVYEPPHRLVISWDISPRWEIETDPERTQRGRSALRAGR